jgi:hypothetical protein
MAVEILTRHDLILFKEDLISELKQIFNKDQAVQKKWLKSDEVRRLLKVSPGTLQTLRVNGTLQYTKIGGIIYYDYDHIQSLLTMQKR